MNKMLEDALAVCRRLLDRLASQVPEVDELVCSGPGTAPIVVRQRVGTRLGIARLCSADPLTITVRGAAADASTRPLPDDLAFDATQSQRPINAPQRAQTLPRVYLLGSMGQLELGPRTTIGRARDSTIPLDDLHISRDHACIIWDADARTFMLEDLGSRAGTMLNYDPVEPHRHYPLHDGDTIEIALNRFEFREPVDQRGANR